MEGGGLLAVAILVVSDTASQDPSTDKSTSLLSDVFDQDGGGQWSVEERKIVPDDVASIQGFTGKDNTPEAVTPLIHKHATGLV
ncbi:MAG: hypothetical protein Q9174_006806 [Haloplaca sp. 1 TL-2023]